MNSQILTLTSPKCTRLDGAGGGLPTITIDDINSSCAGGDPIGMAKMWREVNGASFGRAYYPLYRQVIELAIQNGWQIKEEDRGKHKIRRLLDICLELYISPKTCRACNGTGQNVRFKQCGRCGGGGSTDYTDVEMAEAMEVGIKIWHKVWKKRKNQVLDLLRDTIPERETEALRHLLKRLA